MKTRTKIINTVFCFLLMGCASTYKPINPSNLPYWNKQNCNNKLEVSYLYKIYSASGNKKYANKEIYSSYRAIAVQIKNLTDSSRLITANNFKIYSIHGELKTADKKYFDIVKQKEGIYLLYGLVFPFVTVRSSGYFIGNGEKTYFTPFGLIVGIINTIVAVRANSKHAKEISSNDVYGKTIKPGETLHGIFVLNCSDYYSLDFKYFDK